MEPTRPTPTESAAAERMRRHRERRRKGLRCLTVQLRETEVDALIRLGFLSSGQRDDRRAIVKAVHGLLDKVFRHNP